MEKNPKQLLEGEAWLAKAIRHRLHDQRLNWMAAFVGPPGSGKSWSALRMAELVDDDFTWDQGAFDVDAVLELVWQRGLDRGSAIILDEAGLAIDSRKWYTHANQALSYMVESFRYLGFAFLITVPDPSFIDRIPRSLFNMGFECIRVDRETETVVVRPYRNQLNPRTGKIYTKRPRIWDPERGRVKVRTMRFSRPSDELAEVYERERHAYMQDFHGDLIQKGKEMQLESLSMRDRTKLVLESIEDLPEDERKDLMNTRGFYDADLIQVRFDTSRNVARAAAKILSRDAD